MSYETFAYYYDSLMDPQFYEDYYTFINSQCDFQEVLELGCGTGEIALRLAKDSKRVFATDLSMDMLEVAKQKAMATNVDLMLQRVDMSDFSLSHQVDLILCLCDSINYLVDSQLIIKTFHNVFESLDDKGTFIFDVNSLYKMNVILKDYKEDDVDEDFEFHWHVNNIEDGYVHHYVYIEDKLENEKVEENHYQRTYSVDQYLEWLKSVGFTNIDYFSDFKDYYDDCERVIFVCRKDKL